MDTYFSDVDYVDVSNITFEGSFGAGLTLGLGTGSCDNCSITDVTTSLTGGRGVAIAGDNSIITGVDCSLSSSEVNKNPASGTIIDAGCIVVDSPSDVGVSGGEVYDNIVTNTIKGSCYEVNGFNASVRRINTSFHNNKGYGCTHQGVEIWYTDYSTIEKTLIDNTGYADKILFEKGIMVGNTSSGNTIRNNIVVNMNFGGFMVGEGAVSPNNLFYNNTCYSSVAYTGMYAGCLSDASTSTTASQRNVFKNNVVYMSAGGYIQNSNKSITEYDNNVGYSASGNKYRWNNTNYTYADYLTAYNSATGFTDSSISQDPDINWTTYMPNLGSVSIGFGDDTLGVTDDYNGITRTDNDAGAVEYYVAGSIYKTIRGNGTIIRNATF
jgi:hypothetical protein